MKVVKTLLLSITSTLFLLPYVWAELIAKFNFKKDNYKLIIAQV